MFPHRLDEQLLGFQVLWHWWSPYQHRCVLDTIKLWYIANSHYHWQLSRNLGNSRVPNWFVSKCDTVYPTQTPWCIIMFTMKMNMSRIPVFWRSHITNQLLSAGPPWSVSCSSISGPGGGDLWQGPTLPKWMPSATGGRGVFFVHALIRSKCNNY